MLTKKTFCKRFAQEHNKDEGCFADAKSAPFCDFERRNIISILRGNSRRGGTWKEVGFLSGKRSEKSECDKRIAKNKASGGQVNHDSMFM